MTKGIVCVRGRQREKKRERKAEMERQIERQTEREIGWKKQREKKGMK